MPGKGNAMGHAGRGGGREREGQDGTIGQHEDAVHGRSEQSPGHLKRAAGAQSARDYAQGRTGKAGAGTMLPEAAPDEMAED